MKFSIIILTYNSDLSKILATIKSITSQKFSDYEIIITDDGSDNDHFDKIKQFLDKDSFINYLFIKNEINLGILKNILGALHKSKGQYIKALGPGDLFFHENTLADMFKFMEENSAKFAFGNMMSYYYDDRKNVILDNFSAPRNLKIYRNDKKNKNTILKNLLIYRDWISGITMFADREIMIKYNNILSLDVGVKFCEDLSPVLILLDNYSIDYYDENIVWYEYGHGISTDQNKHSIKLLREDHIKFLEYLKLNYDGNLIVRKAINLIPILTKYSNINNIWLKKVYIIINQPDLFINKISIFFDNKFPKRRVHKRGFLHDELYWRSIDEQKHNKY